MKKLKNELMEIVPERVQTLEKIRDALAVGSVKDYTVDEQIEMSGVMAEAAAAFFFSDKTENSALKAIRLDLYETAMEIAKYLIIDPISKKLTGFLEIQVIARALEHADLRQRNPLHIIYIDIPPRIIVVVARIKGRGTLPPKGEQNDILLSPCAQVAIHQYVHSVCLWPIVDGGHISQVTAVVEIISLLVPLKVGSPEMVNQGMRHAVGYGLPVILTIGSCQVHCCLLCWLLAGSQRQQATDKH